MTGPFTRLIVPDNPSAPGTQSTYLRLGGYTAPDDPLLTGLTTTTSRNTTQSFHPTELDDPKAGTGSKTSDKEAVVTNTPSDPIVSSGKGLLAYTNADLHVNVAKAALMKFGEGHTTEVSTADASYKVAKGFYKISADNGVSISAGTKGGTQSDISLTASNYIKQTAYGPLSEITWGHSEKRTIGDAMEFFGGTKWTCLIGAETTLKIAISTTMFIGAAITMKFLFDFALTVARTIQIRYGGSLTLTFADKTEFIVGEDFKQVAGPSTKIVIGSDKKLTNSDFKMVLGNDLKFVLGTDAKNVKFNYTKCVFGKTDQLIKDEKNLTTAMKDELLSAQIELASEMLSIKSVQTKMGFNVT